jgi:hypothetical protein
MTKPTSEQVTFLASGTGASQRTVLDKLRETFNVMDYVQGDWVPNDSAKDFTPTFAAAIAAVAAAGGGVLEFVGKDNYYFLTRPPEISGGVCLEGNRCIIYKKYIETGTGTYAGAEGTKRGVFSFDGNTNNNTFIRNFSIINDGWDGVDTTGNGSAISIVSDAGDSNGPGIIFISGIHSTATSTGLAAPADYVWWKTNFFFDGSERRTSPIGIRGLYVSDCTLFTAAVASIEAYAVEHLFVNSVEGNVNRTGAVGVKIDGGTRSGGIGAQSDRPMFTGCDFQSVFGYKIGTESAATHSYVQSPVITGTIGQLELGSQALSPTLFGSQTNTLTTASSAYTMVTEDGSNLNGAVAVNGTLTASGRILANDAGITGVKYPVGSTAWGVAHIGAVDTGAYSNPTLAAGESIRITCSSSKLFAVSLGGGAACLFFADYKSATVTLLSNPSSEFTNATGTANKVSITKSANSHQVRIYNEWTATSQIVSICSIGNVPTIISMGV